MFKLHATVTYVGVEGDAPPTGDGSGTAQAGGLAEARLSLVLRLAFGGNMPARRDAGVAWFDVSQDLTNVLGEFVHLGPFTALIGVARGRDSQRVLRMVAKRLRAWLPEDPDELPEGLALRSQDLALLRWLAANVADGVNDPLKTLSKSPLEGHSGESWRPKPDTARRWRTKAIKELASFLLMYSPSTSVQSGEVVSSPVRLADIGLSPPYLSLPKGLNLRAQPSVLLQAKFGVVPFVGRVAVLDRLQHWCTAGEQPFGLTLITGPGGAGKSRIASELGVRLTERGWNVGFVLPSHGPDLLVTEMHQPTLIVVDYAAGETGGIADLVGKLIYRPTSERVRMILLARNRGLWWTTLLGLEPLVENAEGPELALDTELLDRDERQEHYRVAAAAFAYVLGASVPTRGDLEDGPYQFPLLVHLQALLDVLETQLRQPETGNRHSGNAEALLEAMLRREARHWATAFQRLKVSLSPKLERKVVTLASFGGADSRTELKRLLQADDDLQDAPSERLGSIADAVHDLYPGVPHLSPLEPDLLTEQLVASELAAPEILSACFDYATTSKQRARMLAVYVRALGSPFVTNRPRLRAALQAAFDKHLDSLINEVLELLERGQLTGHPLPLVLADALQQAPAPHAAARVADRIPLQVAGLTGLGLVVGEQTVTYYRQRPDTDSETYAQELAGGLSNLAKRASERGRHPEALSYAKEAVDLRRRLFAADRVKWAASLAFSLDALGGCFDDMSDFPEALAASEESTSIYDQLSLDAAYAARSDHATALSNLAIARAMIGRDEDAVEPARRSVELHRSLAEEDRDTYLPFLAESVSILARRLADAGALNEATVHAREAVSLQRQLVQVDPHTHAGGLARALDTLANKLSNDPQHLDEAIALADEAASLFRRLAITDPESGLPSLMISLNIVARLKFLSGNIEESIRSQRGSVAVCRRLADINPEVYQPQLAALLDRLVDKLHKLDRRDEASTVARDVVAIRRQLVARDPDTHTSELAVALHRLANRLVGEEAIEPGQEAVTLYRQLASVDETHRARYLPDLAIALRNQSITLTEADRHDDAVAPAAESVEVYRELTGMDQDSYLPSLATSLTTLSIRLTNADRLDEAANCQTRATEVALQLAQPAIQNSAAMIKKYLGDRGQEESDVDLEKLSQMILIEFDSTEGSPLSVLDGTARKAIFAEIMRLATGNS